MPRGLSDYFGFVGANLRLLAFGFLLCFASSFGQTFFIAVFGAEIRAAFDLTSGSFGAYYSAATLVSGLSMIWLGGLVDRIDPGRFALIVIVGLAVACLGMAVNPVAWLLPVVIFGLRLFGQGLMSHTGLTAMAKSFRRTRGKAVSIAALGFPVGEALFPIAGVLLVAAVGWRGTWGIGALVGLLIIAPLALWLFRGAGAPVDGRRAPQPAPGSTANSAADSAAEPVPPGGSPTAAGPAGAAVADTADAEEIRSWRRREVLRDPRFWLMLPAILAPAFVNTGIFFHQTVITAAKGWPLAFWAAAFPVYAAATVVAATVAGPVIDRIGARRMLPFLLPPLIAAALVLAAFAHPSAAIAYMLLAGLTQGAFSTVIQAIWAELYGTAHLGAIRAMAQAAMVMSSALSPALMGWALDAGAGVAAIALGCAGYMVGAMALAVPALRRAPARAG
jgi:MFS family permease